MAAYKFSQIRKVHLEISSKCNAECPMCPRNLSGYPYNDGYIEKNLSLDEAKKIFQPQFLKQIDAILINGNFGDIVMNPESIDIIKYFRENNPRLMIEISTNGGARNREFWKELANLDTEVHFCLDGLDDTHSLYRRNTLWSTVIENAKTYIAAGGKAVWRMIIFDHNRHQIEECKKISQELGFQRIQYTETIRGDGPVFNRDGTFAYNIGKSSTEYKTVEPLIDARNIKISYEHLLHSIPQEIDCKVMKDNSIYVSSTGEVYPCCFLGFQPDKFGQAKQYTRLANEQLAPLIYENNALEYDLEHCINWFENVVKSWDRPQFQDGRLIWCNDNCGGCK